MEAIEPRFNSVNPVGTVCCSDCPFADDDGFCEPDTPLYGLCNSWGQDHSPCCPTAENYAEACELADTATKRAVKEYGR